MSLIFKKELISEAIFDDSSFLTKRSFDFFFMKVNKLKDSCDTSSLTAKIFAVSSEEETPSVFQ